MKPDKHKKEKNALYKKKHGITDGNRHEKTQEHRDRRGPTPGASAGAGTAAAAGHGRQIQNDRNEFRGKESRLTEENAGKIRQEANPEIAVSDSFQRRKILSNWERYEVEEAEAPTLRGSDFATLLKSSANVQSHFQYQVEHGLTEEEGNLNTNTKFLNLDCDDLAMSLMCIPLHDRLAIETSVFEPSFIQCFIESSKENLSHYCDVKDQLSSEAVPISPPRQEYFEIPNEMEREDQLQETLQAVDIKLLEPWSIDSEKQHVSDAGFAPRQDVDPLLKENRQRTLCKEPTVSEPAQEVDYENRNAKIDKIPPKHDVTENLGTAKFTSDTISKNSVEVKNEAGNVNNKQTLKELENELDLLLGL